MSPQPGGSSESSTSVPSPTQSFQTYLPIITSALDRLTTSANALPDSRSDINFHRTMDRKFANDLDDASDRVLKMAERLLAMVELGQEAAKGKGKATESGKQAKPAAKTATKARRKLEEEDDVVDGYKRGVLSVVDGLLEDADSCLDDLSGQRKKAAIKVPEEKLALAGAKLPGPFAAGKTKERLPSSMLHSKDLAKPQLLFQDAIDNENRASQWMPTLVTKHHAMVPLGFEAPLEYELTAAEKEDPAGSTSRRLRETRLAQHPYYYETRHLPYPTSMFTISDAIEPKSFEETPFTFVDTPEALEQMVDKLRVAKEIAVDLEHHSMRSYYGLTCLMQISDRKEDWIVDTLALRAELREDKLGGVMADPAIVKVFHGSDSDMVWLQRDFDIYVVNLFDTFHATKVLGFAQHSLAYLLSHYCQFEADKRYQMADWRMRPLPEEMMKYARSDTHFLLYIYDRLRNALLEQSSRAPTPVEGQDAAQGTTLERRNPQEAMREVLERSGETALRLHERDYYDRETGRGAGGWATSAKRLLEKGAIDEEQGAVFKALHAWRDQVARELDESVFYILPNFLLKPLSIRHFRASGQIMDVIGTRAPAIAGRAREILELTTKAREDFRQAQGNVGAAVDSPTAPVAPTTSEGAATTGPATLAIPVFEDMWSTLPVKAEAKSSLFGSSISKAPTAPKPITKGKTSGLFGKTISKSVSSAPTTFDDVKSRIFAALTPMAPAPDALLQAATNDAKTSASAPPPTESSTATPIIVDDDATPAASTDAATAAAEGPSPPKRAKRDEIVQVKKKSKKASSAANGSAKAGPSKVPSVSDSVNGQKEDKKPAKKRPAAGAIPEFDYSKTPNLLDNPRSGIKDAGKKKKKEKKERKEFAGADFGPAPKEKSNMRSGNKSGTF